MPINTSVGDETAIQNVLKSGERANEMLHIARNNFDDHTRRYRYPGDPLIDIHTNLESAILDYYERLVNYSGEISDLWDEACSIGDYGISDIHGETFSLATLDKYVQLGMKTTVVDTKSSIGSGAQETPQQVYQFLSLLEAAAAIRQLDKAAVELGFHPKSDEPMQDGYLPGRPGE